MDLLTYVSDTDRRYELAAKLECSPGYLWQIATNWRGRKASPALAQRIAEATAAEGDLAVPLHLIRPDVWLAPRVDGEGR